jgi:hypothetical protein
MILTIIILMTSLFGNLPSAAANVVVIEHGFAKALATISGKHPIQWDGLVNWMGWMPANRTDSFSQDDYRVYAYTYANFTATSTTSANLTWVWYRPGGAIYYDQRRTVACWRNVIPFTYCQYYSAIYIRGYSSAAHLGTWRVDFYADSVLLYSDSFVIQPIVTEQDSFDVNLPKPTVTVVNATIIIHPDNSSWNEYVMVYAPSHAVNFTAFDPETERDLQFNQTRGRVVVNLGGTRYDGYKLNIGFNFTRSAILRTNNNYTLRWSQYNGGLHPIPQTFTITLPAGYSILGHSGIANYTKGLIGGRPSLAFNVTTVPYNSLQWSLTYGQISPEITTTSHTTHVTQVTQPVQMTLSGLPGIVLSGTTFYLQGTVKPNATTSRNVTIYVDGAVYANASSGNSFMFPVAIPLFTSSGAHNLTAVYQSTAPSGPLTEITVTIFVINTPTLIFTIVTVAIVSVILLMLRSRHKKRESRPEQSRKI